MYRLKFTFTRLPDIIFCMEIIRIVKMHFKHEHIPAFLAHFEEKKEAIRSAAGCTSLHLLQDTTDPGIIFTYSIWTAATYLEEYRRSELFRTTWGYVRTLFDHRAEAWSVHTIHTL